MNTTSFRRAMTHGLTSTDTTLTSVQQKWVEDIAVSTDAPHLLIHQLENASDRTVTALVVAAIMVSQREQRLTFKGTGKRKCRAWLKLVNDWLRQLATVPEFNYVLEAEQVDSFIQIVNMQGLNVRVMAYC